MNAVTPPRHARDNGSGWRHIGGVVDGVVHAIGLRVIMRRLAEAAEGDDGEALAKFREADQIRCQLGLRWNQVFASETSLVREAA